jgi:hypothetical protein
VVVAGFNDLASQFPAVGAEWDETRNGGITADRVAHGSARKAFWRCARDHEWQAFIYNRTRHGTGCPTCAGQRPSVGETDFATTHPILAAELHPTLNGGLSAMDFMAGSELTVWWLCAAGHEWRSMVPTRVRHGNKCPKCTGYRQGFRAHDPGLIYFIGSPSLGARKIGISNNSRRVRDFGSAWEVRFQASRQDGRVIAAAERAVLRWLRRDLLLPYYLSAEDLGHVGGHTETFAELEGPSDLDVIARIQVELARVTPSITVPLP